MNTFLIAYMKWVTEMMTIPVQVSQTVMTNSINQATGAAYRAKKQKVSAEIVSITAKADKLKEKCR